MKENEIIELAEQLDNFFSQKIIEKELSINAFNGVFMARLVRMNQEIGNMESFNHLLHQILHGNLNQGNKRNLQ